MTPAPPGRHPLVMGVLNVTPDSFSDGGLYETVDLAVAHGAAMATEGADVIDVGGESSRPGAEPVPTGVELERVVPVIDALAATPALISHGVRISVDTTKPDVATAAVAAGATLINDISASLYEVAAATGAGWVAMHMQGEPRTMQDDPHYDDVVGEVTAFVLGRARLAHDAGVAVGTSRKRFLGLLAAGPDGQPAPLAERLPGSIATAAAALTAGARMVRVHDVAATVQLTRLYGPAA